MKLYSKNIGRVSVHIIASVTKEYVPKYFHRFPRSSLASPPTFYSYKTVVPLRELLLRVRLAVHKKS